MSVGTATTRPNDPIKKIMVTTLAAVDAGDPLRSVARELVADEVGAVLVGDGRHTVGLISERDLVTVFASGGDIDSDQALDIMTSELLAAGPDDSIAVVGRMMLDGGVRHIVVRDGTQVIGLVSIRDVLAVLLPDGD
jgi:CBS domain-containing protein